MKPHRARIFAMQGVYLQEFQKKSIEEISKFQWIDYKINEDEKKFAIDMIRGVDKFKKEIDAIIKDYSENWNFDRIDLVSKSILKISIFQIIHLKDMIPAMVVIDEAVKISKEYAEESASRFINGLLDSFYQKEILKKINA